MVLGPKDKTDPWGYQKEYDKKERAITTEKNSESN
jgi:hypothetical protein